MILQPKVQSYSNMRAKAISGIGTPLGFMVLALMIIEGFLIGAGSLFNLPLEIRIIALFVGVGLFVGVVSIVVFLVIKYPKNLVFSESSHLQMALYGIKDNPLTYDSISQQSASFVEQADMEVQQISSLRDLNNGENNE